MTNIFVNKICCRRILVLEVLVSCAAMQEAVAAQFIAYIFPEIKIS